MWPHISIKLEIVQMRRYLWYVIRMNLEQPLNPGAHAVEMICDCRM